MRKKLIFHRLLSINCSESMPLIFVYLILILILLPWARAWIYSVIVLHLQSSLFQRIFFPEVVYLVDMFIDKYRGF